MQIGLGMDLLNALLLHDTESAGPPSVHNRHSREEQFLISFDFKYPNCILLNKSYFLQNFRCL